MSENNIVLKFGSSVLRTNADLPNVVHEIYRWVRMDYRVIAVVSAIGDTTDNLLVQLHALSKTPESFAAAELLATGERASAALLGVALDRAGLPARLLNPREISLTVAGSPLDAELVNVDVARLRALLIEYPVLVVPGFFGTDVAGRTHLLGRGGSDLSAVFLANILGARCRLIKDVDGVYEADPANCGALLQRFTSLNYSDALRVAGPLIQPKSIVYLEKHGGFAEVAAIARPYESLVYFGPTQLAPAKRVRPLKVLLLGLGIVGLGVYQRLQANPQHFEVAGALVRDRAKYENLDVPSGLLHSEPHEVLSLRADIVIDALPAVGPSRDLVQHFLSNGAHVVSAGKALIAEHGTSLSALAAEHGGSLRYRAAVGGAAPMIESLDSILAEGTITSIAAVLNGTCNYVLDACAGGATLAAAVADAKREGFAEADPSEDLSGRDAERKLRILCRHCFHAEPETIDVAKLVESEARRARVVAQAGQQLRQIARATRETDGVHAQVHLEAVDADSFFGRVTREWNALETVDFRHNRKCVSGRGAGRWPTTEAVMAEVFDLYRLSTQPELPKSEVSRILQRI